MKHNPWFRALVAVLAVMVLVALPLYAVTFEAPAPSASPPQLVAEVTPFVVVTPAPLISNMWRSDHSPCAGHGDGGERDQSSSRAHTDKGYTTSSASDGTLKI